MKKINWNEVEDKQEFIKPTSGGYVCKITMAEDVADKEYLRLEYDFAEPPLKDYYADLHTAKGFWGGKFIKSYKDTALRFFKAFKTAVEESNSGYVFNGDERTLVGKQVGLVLGEEEYNKNDGTIGTRLFVAQERSVAAIRRNDFTVPQLKKLSANTVQRSFKTTPVDDDVKLPWEM